MPFLQLSNALVIPSHLKTPLLTDNLGLPRYWAVVWSSIKGKDLAESTEVKRLRYIESLYLFNESIHEIGLDDMLSECRIDDLGNLLEAYFISLRNRPSLTEASQKQWQAGLNFVKDVILRLSKNERSANKLIEIERRLLHLDALYGQLRIKKADRPDILRSLPAPVVEHLYEVLDPESPKNPFTRVRTRWNVFQAFILMLHQGLRRGEVLLMPVNAVKTGFEGGNSRQRFWMNVREIEDHVGFDSRYNRPSIKNANSIRQIPISDLTAKLIQSYAENFRGKPEHPFLLNTQWDTPLSHDSLTAYFTKLSSKLPSTVRRILQDRTGKDSIEPHDLRHTCAVVRLNQLLSQAIPFDVAMQQLRAFFGWSRTSDMPRRYARAVFEDRLSSVWTRVMDERIEILKSLPGRQ